MDEDTINKIGEIMALCAAVMLFANVMAGGFFVLLMAVKAIAKVLFT